MAYIQPLVMVFQEYAKQSTSTQTASLNACVVGPCFHILDEVEDELLAYAGDMGVGGLVGVMVPNNKPGAQIVEDSVSIRFKDVIIELSGTPFVAGSSKDNQVVFTDVTFPSAVALGDIVAVSKVSDATVLVEEARVIAIDQDAYTVKLNTLVGTFAEDLNVVITREVDEYTITVDDSSVSVDVQDEVFSVGPQTCDLDGTVVSIVSAKVYVGYKALRTDLSSIGTVYTTDEAEAALGALVPENPLGYGVALTLANTTTGVKYIGVDSEDVVGYTAAKDRLESVDDVYSIVPLSQKAEILGIFNQHIQQLSDPEQGKWRCCIASTPLVTETVLQEGTATLENNDDNLAIVLRDLDATFLSNSVDAGNTVELTDDLGNVSTYYVEEVIADQLLVLDNANPVSGDFVVGNDYSYRVVQALDKTAQAKAIAATSSSFGYQRFIHVWPDVCTIDDVELPGYYLACSVAGMTAGLSSHQGFTRISSAGIGGLKHSNDYFNEEQLNIIADGGTFIFCQSNPSAAPYVRHQLTTDMSTTEFKEFSFVKNFDYVSYICKDVMDQFLGKYNITVETLGILETALRGTLESLKLYKLPKIGSPVLAYDVVSVAQLDDIRDRVEMYASVWFPYALNNIGLQLVSQIEG